MRVSTLADSQLELKLGPSIDRAWNKRGLARSIRIVIADDHELVRRGLRALIESQPGWEICGEAATGRQAVELVKELHPDIIILDISMPLLNGLEATRQILRAVPKTEVLILTIHDTEELEREILAAGAHGYILKSDDGRDLMAAIDSLSRHRPYFTDRVTNMVLEDSLRTRLPLRDRAEPVEPLSSREREVLQLIAEGHSTKEVATRLNIGVKTAETHRLRLMRKLGLHSLSEIVHYAIRNHIVEP